MGHADVGNPALPRDEDEKLQVFTRRMREKLLKNAHKGGWRGLDPVLLLQRAIQELEELRREIIAYRKLKLNALNSETNTGAPVEVVAHEKELLEQGRKITYECADVANFMLMIADVVGGLL